MLETIIYIILFPPPFPPYITIPHRKRDKRDKRQKTFLVYLIDNQS